MLFFKLVIEIWLRKSSSEILVMWFHVCSIGTDATDTSDVLDVQERSNRADFSQELLMSTFFLE